MDAKFTELVEQLNGLDFKGMYGSDFLHTWDKTTDELKALYIVADALRELRENNVSSKIFDSGLAVSLFRDNSTRTRFSFSKAANLLGLELQDLDEKKSQIAHGETVRETATMISFMADVIGIRDDMYIGKGDAYMAEVSESVQQAYEDGVLDRRYQLLVCYSIVFVLGNLVMALAPNFQVLFISRIILGSVSGALLAVGVTYIPEFLSPQQTSLAISVLYVAISVALAFVTTFSYRHLTLPTSDLVFISVVGGRVINTLIGLCR